MDGNTYYSYLAMHMNNLEKKRIKGYYICRDCGEFIKAIPRKISNCPFCNRECNIIMKLDDLKEKMTLSIWKESGCYSDLRADKRTGGKL